MFNENMCIFNTKLSIYGEGSLPLADATIEMRCALRRLR